MLTYYLICTSISGFDEKFNIFKVYLLPRYNVLVQKDKACFAYRKEND